MQTLKRILIGLGIVFIGLVVVVGALFLLQGRFAKQHEAFIRQFMADYSQRWEVADVHNRVTNEFLEQIQSSGAHEALALFRRLGAVREITDLSIKNFNAGPQGRTGTFTFKAQFENAPALVKLTVRESDGQVRVHWLHITPNSDPSLVGRGQTST